MAPNVLLVILDAVRARNCSFLGHHRSTTPSLHQFADQATVYSQARAPSNWSLPSHTSIFTGLHVPEHGVEAQYDKLKSGFTIWEWLQDRGYDTAVFSQNDFITVDQYGLNQGFEKIYGRVSDRQSRIRKENHSKPRDDGSKLLSCIDSAVQSVEDRIFQIEQAIPYLPRLPIRPQYRSPAAFHTRQFLEWVNDQEGDWAACLNFMDANMLYYTRSGTGKWDSHIHDIVLKQLDHLRWDFHSGRQPWWKLQLLEELYDGAIRLVDEQVGILLDTLENRGILNDTLIVITSDHGEGFGERSRLRPELRIGSHSIGIHECLQHVPLLVRHPSQSCRNDISTPVSLTMFPYLVKQVVQSTELPPTEGLISEDPVFSSCRHDRLYQYVLSEKRWGTKEYADEIPWSRFRGTAYAVYEKNGKVVNKDAVWDDSNVEVQISDAHNTMKIGEKPSSQAQDFAQSLSYKDVRANQPEIDAINEETLDRLQSLGYK